VEVVAFFAGCEAWKWAKRIFFRRRARRLGLRKEDLEMKVFGAYTTTRSEDDLEGKREGEK
jgi:P-type Na+/K+ transporter